MKRNVKFDDFMVTKKAYTMLEKAFAAKQLGLPCVIEFENDDSDFATLESFRDFADDMGGLVIRLMPGTGQGCYQVTERNISSGHFLVWLP